MSFIIKKQLNADGQEGSAGDAGETAATTNVPVENMESNETEVETKSVVDMEVKEQVEEKVATAHDDFDWSVDKRNVTSYTADEKAKYDTVYDNTFKQINDGQSFT